MTFQTHEERMDNWINGGGANGKTTSHLLPNWIPDQLNIYMEKLNLEICWSKTEVNIYTLETEKGFSKTQYRKKDL